MSTKYKLDFSILYTKIIFRKYNPYKWNKIIDIKLIKNNSLTFDFNIVHT